MGQTQMVQKLIRAAFLLEDHIETGFFLYNKLDCPQPSSVSKIIQYYSSTQLHPRQVKHSRLSLAQQLYTPPLQPLPIPNWYSILDTHEIDTMIVDQSVVSTQKPAQSAQPTKFWVQDTSLSTIAEIIDAQLKQDATAQPDEDIVDKHLGEEHAPQQHLRLNLVRHRGAMSSLKTIDLFKSFALALRAADPLLVILPYASTKQHYTPITSTKQIQAVEENKMLQFFQPYYKKQRYSLSGYFHMKSSLSFKDLFKHHLVEEWLDLHCYSLKLCPSQTKEMVPVGALCFSNLFMHRKELKRSILLHPSWNHADTDEPIFDI
jgi:hypothetical protein